MGGQAKKHRRETNLVAMGGSSPMRRYGSHRLEVAFGSAYVDGSAQWDWVHALTSPVVWVVWVLRLVAHHVASSATVAG